MRTLTSSLSSRNAASVQLAAPTVDDATSGYLDPRTIGFSTIARVPASVELLPGDTLTMHFGGETIPGEPPEFYVGALTIGRFLGATVEVYYTLLRNGVSTDSNILSLRIDNFSEQDPALPRPAIAEATGDRLDLATFDGPAHVTLGTWPLTMAGQVIWLEVHGIAGGGPKPIILLDSHVVTAEEATYGLRCPLSRAELEALDDGSAVTVKAWVSFGGSPYKPNGVLFPVQSYSLRQAGPRVIDFENYPIGEYPSGSTFGQAKIIDIPNVPMKYDVTDTGGNSPPYIVGHRLHGPGYYLYFQFDQPYQHASFAFGVPRGFERRHIGVDFYTRPPGGGDEGRIERFEFLSEAVDAVRQMKEFHTREPFTQMLVWDAGQSRIDMYLDNLQVG